MKGSSTKISQTRQKDISLSADSTACAPRSSISPDQERETEHKEVSDLRKPVTPLHDSSCVLDASKTVELMEKSSNAKFVHLPAQSRTPNKWPPPPPPRKESPVVKTHKEAQPTAEDLRRQRKGEATSTKEPPEAGEKQELPSEDGEQRQNAISSEQDMLEGDASKERAKDPSLSSSPSQSVGQWKSVPLLAHTQSVATDMETDEGGKGKSRRKNGVVSATIDESSQDRLDAILLRMDSPFSKAEKQEESRPLEHPKTKCRGKIPEALAKVEASSGNFGSPIPTAVPLPVSTITAPPLPTTGIGGEKLPPTIYRGLKPPMRQQLHGTTQAYPRPRQQPAQHIKFQHNQPMQSTPQNFLQRGTAALSEGPIHNLGLPSPKWRRHQGQKHTSSGITHSTMPTSHATSGAPVFRSLRSKVETSLDGLANIRDASTGPDQQLVYTAAPNSFPSKAEPGGWVHKKPQQSCQDPMSAPLSGPQVRWQQKRELYKQKTAAAKNKENDPIFLNSGVSWLQSNVSSTPLKETIIPSSATSTGQSVKGSNTSDPLTLKAGNLMPAKGGASPPNEYNWNYPGQGLYSNVQPPLQTNPMEPSAGDVQYAPLEIQRGTDSAYLPPCVGPTSPDASKQDSGEQSQQPFVGTMPGLRCRDAKWPPGETTKRCPIGKPSCPPPFAATPVSQPVFPDDDEDNERQSYLLRLLGSVPVLRIANIFGLRRKNCGNASFDGWDAEEEGAKQSWDFFGLFGRGRYSAKAITSVAVKRRAAKSQHIMAKPLQALMEKSKNGKVPCLLTAGDKRVIRGLGKSRAMLDVISLGLFLVGIRQLHGLEHIPFPGTLAEMGSLTLPNLLSTLFLSADTWAPLTFAAAILTVLTNSLLFSGRIQRKATDVATAAESETSYGSLFVRLVLSTPTDRKTHDFFSRAALLQVMALAELSRLRSFITYTIATILLMTVAFVRPLVLTSIGSIVHIVTLQEWRSWPLPTGSIWVNVKDTAKGVGHEFKDLMEIELKGAGHYPMQVAFKVSILAALLFAAFLPSLEHRRAVTGSSDDQEENTSHAVRQMTERLSNLGASSAGRLWILSKDGWIENLIERWSLLKEEASNSESDISVGPLFRRVCYCAASWSLLAAPILLFGFLLNTPMTGWSSSQMPRWESLLEISVLLLFTNKLLWKAIAKCIESTSMHPTIAGLLKSVSEASDELSRHSAAPPPFASSPNPMAGIVVRDLWAAHEVKRAWAIRAAHLTCRNGEVVVVLGDDGAGKSRLLTTVAESILKPPKGAMTARVQRGSVSIGGIDIGKWDHNQLRRRVGLLLNDVNTLSNYAGIASGLSLEEILEPGDGRKVTVPTHTLGAKEKSCMVRALKITGLYWSLLPRLPTKLSSVLSANEEDMLPSPIRPRYHVLSPTEWSKLLLAKLLAQALYDNENSYGSNDKVDDSLLGSLFILDEGTQLLSEIDEAKFFRDLRRTGVATILSSNKWATGRLADRIVIMQDGCVIESGTHNELLSRGPQQSVYASKWHALTAFG